jgi:thiol:disulfide interchange protein
MKPVVDGLQQEYEGKVEFKLYDVEKSAEGEKLMRQYGAQFVPTFVFVNADGTTSETIVGAVTESKMKAALDKLK